MTQTHKIQVSWHLFSHLINNHMDAGSLSRTVLTVRSWAGYERVSRLAGRSSSPASPLQQPAGPVLACGYPSHGSPHHCSPDHPPSQRQCVEGLEPWQVVLGRSCALHWVVVPGSGSRCTWVSPWKLTEMSSRPRSYLSDNAVEHCGSNSLPPERKKKYNQIRVYLVPVFEDVQINIPSEPIMKPIIPKADLSL